jgi:hypothetical protein
MESTQQLRAYRALDTSVRTQRERILAKMRRRPWTTGTAIDPSARQPSGSREAFVVGHDARSSVGAGDPAVRPLAAPADHCSGGRSPAPLIEDLVAAVWLDVDELQALAAAAGADRPRPDELLEDGVA